MRVFTDGKRNEQPLTKEQFDALKEIAIEYGFDGEILYSDDSNTAFHRFTEGGDWYFLVIGSDALPAENNGGTPNELISARGCIAHEVIGHYLAYKRGTTQSELVLEEAQASIRASKYADGLSKEEREVLWLDAMERLQKAGIRYEDVESQLDIWEK